MWLSWKCETAKKWLRIRIFAAWDPMCTQWQRESNVVFRKLLIYIVDLYVNAYKDLAIDVYRKPRQSRSKLYKTKHFKDFFNVLLLEGLLGGPRLLRWLMKSLLSRGKPSTGAS